MPSKKYKHIIIGAGPTGLGAAYRLKELGVEDFILLEANDYVGGLATSFRDDKNFVWDIGGHVQFSHYSYFDTLMNRALQRDGWLNHQRESWAWMEKRFVPYPVQNNIRYLSRETMWKCLEGVITANQNPNRERPKNFHEWILAVFGQGLAEVFMLPYNFKVWAFPPKEMDYNWIGERVAITDVKRVTKNILFEKDDLSWGPNNTFQFPREGGTGAIWQAVADLIGRDKILLKHKVCSVNAENKTLKVQDDKGSVIEFAYEDVLSTMPVSILVDLLGKQAPENFKLAAAQLKYSTSHIVGIGLKGAPSEALRTKCWMYFPEGDCPFYRTTVFSNYSPNNAPAGHWSLMTETSESTAKKVNREQLIEDTIQGCLNTRLIESRDQIVSTWMFSAKHGYPTPSLERDEALKVLLPGLEKLSLYSRGRFGAWKYEVSNQDHSCMQGVEWASRVTHGTPELTAFFPNTANANWGKQ